MAFAFADPKKLEKGLPAKPPERLAHPAIMGRQSEAARKGFVEERWW